MSMRGPVLTPDALKKAPKSARTAIAVEATATTSLLSQEQFLAMLCLERKRSERSRRSFVLMLLSASKLLRSSDTNVALEHIVSALSRSTRETDIKGWYKEDAVLGVVFTELGPETDGRAVANALLTKVSNALSGVLTIREINEISLSFHVFPDDWERKGPGSPADSILYPDRWDENGSRRATRIIKRTIDVAGSLCALIFFMPLLLLIALAIKMTSRGPVLFRQERLGHRGAPFQFLKFRSMYVKNDAAIHAEYVKNFIAGKGVVEGGKVYKLTGDPRVTSVGRFLRKTSLDELPQFLNVLKGEMSLVGPRPPVRYEVACYHPWHRDRLLAARPGITGLWQVEGRSRVTFDDMVRLDLRYARTWSLMLDLKILLRTPRVVLMGDGAY